MAAGQSLAKPIFECPSWAGKPPPGLHLDVVKGDKLIEKLIIDEKKYYLFGRNPDICDFTIDHQSCSRVHAALVYHRHLKRVFLVDLNSTHGTFLGHIRLEAHKPQQVPIDSTVSFGASTRMYTLREKPQTLPSSVKGEEKAVEDEELKGLLGLPEEETELDVSCDNIGKGPINLLSVVTSAILAGEKKKLERPGALSLDESVGRRMQNFAYSGGLYGGLPPTHSDAGSQAHSNLGTALIGGLPMPFPNLAPEVELTPPTVPTTAVINPTPNPGVFNAEAGNEPKKKKYAKEAWPGKKPAPSLLI
nr:PREDICTED: nuclear inhibitor of protein phosphatase 1 [Latimeria chalumnae]|eukprot:XP_014349631.1 PREDICTED: nuclear inhibitor of protein phosphatase 1 [Latimeria chalumnae]